MQEDRINQGNIIEINLMDIIWSVLRCWRNMLAAMVIAGVLLAGYGAFKEYRHLTDKAFVKEQQEAYESDLETYALKKKQLEKKLENLEEDLARQEFYEKNAVMLLFDQYDVYIRTASYYINSGYEIVPELYYQNPNYTSVITNSYKAAVDRIDLDAVIATDENPELTTRNPISGSKKMLYTSVDAGNGVLNITIYGDTQERVDQIYAAVQKVIKEQESLLNKVIGEHTISILSEESYSDIDIDFGSLQRSFDDKSESITLGLEETKKALEELKAPINETPTKKSVVKAGIKFGIVGVAAGLLLLGGFFLLKILLQDKVNAVEDIRRRYFAPVLGTYLDGKRKMTKLDVFLTKKLGFAAAKSTEEQVQFIVSNIRFYLKEQNKILLVGNCESDLMDAIKEQLVPLLPKIEIEVGGNVNENALAVDALSQDAAVICVECWTKTPHKEIRHEMKAIADSGNVNLGYIVAG